MKALHEELKVKPDEGALEYAERAEAVPEHHHRETGERFSVWTTMPEERVDEVLERTKVLREAEGIREAERTRRRAAKTSGPERENDATTHEADGAGQRYRIRSQERDVERAVSEFEAAKKRLYRFDGSKVYGEEEHAERLGKLAEELREKVEAVAKEAAEDAEGYEGEALSLSHIDPTQTVPASELGHLEASTAFVKEDCEDMLVPALTEGFRGVGRLR